MATHPKRLRILGARPLGAATRALAVECVEGDPFERAGGKYVIVHTGVVVADRAIKRAYSLVPIAGRPRVFELVAKLLGGPGSSAMHAAAVGAELGFSGPWGKLAPEGGLPRRTLLVATDTGVTSALGLVEQHRSEDAEVLWLREDSEAFLDVGLVRARVEAAGARFVTAAIPGPAAADRPDAAFGRVEARVRELGPALVVATGDGRIVQPLARRLHPVEVRFECYFNNPDKKVAG